MNYSIFIFIFCISPFIGLSDGVPSMVVCAWGNPSKVMIDHANEEHDSHVSKVLDDDDVKTYLFKKDSPYPFQLFLNDETRLVSGNFEISKPTYIFVHGYKSSIKSSSSTLIRNALLNNGDFNVIVMDWSPYQYWGFKGAFPKLYPKVVSELPNVADYITRFVKFLKSYGMNIKTTTLIGHSLGAHAVGIANYNLESKVPRIVGLDPAGPYFHHKGVGERLSKEDAEVVEVIHSEKENCGLSEQLGHYDFYPNGGMKQPGCKTNKCSHSRSYRYFAESLTANNQFWARKCKDLEQLNEEKCDGAPALMGGLFTKNIEQGIYYLKTRDSEPFALGKTVL